MERDLATSVEFRALRPKLRDLRDALPEIDPLSSIVDALLEGEGGE